MFAAFKNPLVAVRNPYGSSHNPYDRDPLDELPGVMVTAPFDDKVRARLVKARPEALYLNAARGWRCGDYSFLGALPGLQLLSIVAAPLKAPLPVGALAELRSLKLDGPLPQAVDLAALPALRTCRLTWSAAARSVLACRGLERLGLAGLKSKRIDRRSELRSLTALRLRGSNLVSLQDLAGLDRLVHRTLRSAEASPALRASRPWPV